MALATQCPHCGTMFRVASDQLKLRGGIVRCGSCQEIFDGSATLVDLDAAPVKAAAPAGPQPPVEAGPVAEAAAPSSAPSPSPDPVFPEDEALAPLDVAVALPNFDDQPVYTLDFDHTFDPFGILPKVDAPDALPPDALDPAAAKPVAPLLPPWSQLLKNPEAPARADIDPVLNLAVDEELVAAALPGHEPEPEPETVAGTGAAPTPPLDDAPLLKRESTAGTTPSVPAAAHIPPVARTPAARRADKAAARRSKLTPTRIESQPKLRAAEIDEPEFVKRGRQQEQTGRARKIALVAGAIALLVLLFMQGTLTFRNALAARFPAAKPALVSACAVFGCRVELPAQVDDLAIETGELTTLGGGAYAFTTELRNAGSLAQAWPSLELALLDANEKPLVRRVFAPNDYLAPGAVLANGIAPRAAQAIKLHFRVDDLKPSGYHIAVFYP